VVGKKGLLLLNLGSPEKPTISSIRHFLRVFLQDPRVIDLPWWLRYPLVYGLVLPFRPKKILPQYKEIWQAEGSPLLVHSKAIAKGLEEQLQDDFVVKLAMRHGRSSIQKALSAFSNEGIHDITVLPLFPQYASSTTGSLLAEIFLQLKKFTNIPQVHYIQNFFVEPFFIQSMARKYQAALDAFNADFVLFSYHGLPVSQVEKSESKGRKACENELPCPIISEANRYCYRAQCFATSIALGQSLWLDSAQYKTVFQSRFGKAKWIAPQTDKILTALREKGVNRLAVACPSFVCDCLETLEEINIRLREQWAALGGTDFLFLPCVNADPHFVKLLAGWVRGIAFSPCLAR
jgi:ferrochelatase